MATNARRRDATPAYASAEELGAMMLKVLLAFPTAGKSELTRAELFTLTSASNEDAKDRLVAALNLLRTIGVVEPAGPEPYDPLYMGPVVRRLVVLPVAATH